MRAALLCANICFLNWIIKNICCCLLAPLSERCSSRKVVQWSHPIRHSALCVLYSLIDNWMSQVEQSGAKWATCGNVWQCVAICGNVWQLVEICGNLGQMLATFGNFWQAKWSQVCNLCTVPQSKGDPKILKRGPKGDPILSKKGTKRGPKRRKRGPKIRFFQNCSQKANMSK